MKQNLAAGIVAIAVIGGIGAGFTVDQLRSDPAEASGSTDGSAAKRSAATSPSPSPTRTATKSPSPTPTPSPTPDPTTPVLLSVAAMRILPGSVGPVSVGMSKAEAEATGYFDVDVPSQVCDGAYPILQWKSGYGQTFDVLTNPNGSISAIGISQPGPATRSGLQVGSTYAEVRRVLGANATSRANDYDQAGLLINDGDAWIGFSFDADANKVTGATKVSFIEVTRGQQPGLLRDGC